MIYEIINPSDAVTIEADDIGVAQATCIVLGRGQYGLTDEEGQEAMPLLLFGRFDEWAEKNQFELESINKQLIKDCLNSAICCTISERSAIAVAIGDDLEAMARYNDKKRSSMNDICGRAFDLAEQVGDAE